MKIQAIHGRPIFFEGGDAGVLLLHGLTGTPQCMRYLAEALHKAKFTVSVPVLEGHGTTIEHFEKTTWEDWYQSVESAFHQLKSICKVVMVAGLSLGGLLSAHLARHHAQTVKAVGFMATPLFLDGFMVRTIFPAVWNTPLKKIYKYQPKTIASIRDPAARRRYETYHKIPVVNVASLLEFQNIVRDELKHIRQPAIVMHSVHDQTVPYANLDFLKAVLASEEVQTVTLKRSNHIITVDYDKAIVAKQMIKFFRKYRKVKG
jgi:carboxylesterase